MRFRHVHHGSWPHAAINLKRLDLDYDGNRFTAWRVL